MTRGLRNNNPGNIRKGGDIFRGEVLPSSDPAFKQFKTMAWGYRAMFVTLDTYRKRGLDTIEKIVDAWAPPNENNTAAYAASVAKWSGVPAGKRLTEYCGADYIRIVCAMSRVENGTPASLQNVEQGFALQNRIK
ncbi:MAG: structural protein P5 [Prevotella sp.]|jgi:hypothetical protein|nr:structural protein P5 [Prevotella sp.]